jgi:hypothetical protein
MGAGQEREDFADDRVLRVRTLQTSAQERNGLCVTTQFMRYLTEVEQCKRIVGPIDVFLTQ